MNNSDIFDKFDSLPENRNCIKVSVNSDSQVYITSFKVNCCLIQETDIDYMKSLTGKELHSLVQNLAMLNIWNKIEVDKGFNWISHIGIISGKNIKDDGYPDLNSFSFLLKGKGSIFSSGGKDTKIIFIETKPIL